MTWFEILVEGGSDVPALREILTRKFALEENTHFRIHPHKGRGKLPANPLARPDLRHQALLDQLPAKLRGFSYHGDVDNPRSPSLKKLIEDLSEQAKQGIAQVTFRN